MSSVLSPTNQNSLQVMAPVPTQQTIKDERAELLQSLSDTRAVITNYIVVVNYKMTQVVGNTNKKIFTELYKKHAMAFKALLKMNELLKLVSNVNTSHDVAMMRQQLTDLNIKWNTALKLFKTENNL